MKIVVCTALFGERAPRAPTLAVASAARYVCLSDRPIEATNGWESRAMRTLTTVPRFDAREVKMHLWQWFPEADVTIWLDASFALKVDPLEIVTDALRTRCDVVGFAHPDRCRITEEAECVIAAKQATPASVRLQVQTYHENGFDTPTDPQRVLTTTGLLVRFNTIAARNFDEVWFAHIRRHTLRDQLSVDYCAWARSMPIGHLPGSYRENQYADYDRARRIRTVL